MINDEDLLAGGDGGDVSNFSELDEKQLLAGDEIKREQNELDLVDELGADDLYDAAIEPSGGIVKKESVDSASNQTPQQTNESSLGPSPAAVSSSTSVSSGSIRRYQCYVGNCTWWTTDDDLIKAIEAYGVTDVVEIRFAENRHNGQSRGFATVTTTSENSMKTIMDRLPGRKLHGNLLIVLPFNKHSLARLEDATKTSSPMDKKDDKTSIPNLGTVRIGASGPPMNMMSRPMQMGPLNGGMLGFQGGPNMMQMNMPPQMMPSRMMSGPPMQQMNRPPPNFPPGVSNINTAQTMNTLLQNRQTVAQPIIPPGTHVNPHVYPYLGQPGGQQRREGQGIPPNDYEEIMRRNRNVSSSAISRAMSDAAAGEISAAIDTLNTAMSLIRSSRIGEEEGCKALLNTLQEALRSVKSKREHSRKHSRRSRSRSKSRERKHRRRRSRSRD